MAHPIAESTLLPNQKAKLMAQRLVPNHIESKTISLLHFIKIVSELLRRLRSHLKKKI